MKTIEVFDVSSGYKINVKVDGFGIYRGMMQLHQKSRHLDRMLRKRDKEGNPCFYLYEQNQMFPMASIVNDQAKKDSAAKAVKKEQNKAIAKAKVEAKPKAGAL